MTTTSAYVSTINADRTVVLPEEIPIGTKVAIILLSQGGMPQIDTWQTMSQPIFQFEQTHDELLDDKNAVRNMRFQRVMDTIRSAIQSQFTPPDISDQDLNQLIREARQTAKV